MTTEKKSFKELVEASDVPVLVDVYSDTCGPCIALKPVLQELKSKMGEDLRIIKINGYTNMAFMNDYQIRAFPTLMLFREGKMVWRHEGYMTASALERQLRQN